MWFWERIVELLMFPIKWFFFQYKKYKKEKSLWKIVLLFFISVSGLIIIGGTLIWLAMYILTYHMEWVVIAGLIIWLYAYVKAKMDREADATAVKQQNKMLQISQTEKQQYEQAEKGYPVMRNVIYQSLKECAESIGGVIPRLLQEIEVERRYIIVNGICFYQFKLAKADIRILYNNEDIAEFIDILQNVISRKLQNKDFPALVIETQIDQFGIRDAVVIDTIEDMGNCFVIQAVFSIGGYPDYYRQKQMDRQALPNKNELPDATWRE